MWQVLVQPIFDSIGEVIKRVLPPEKMSEADRARLEQELRFRIMEVAWNQYEAEIRDMMNARQLAQAELSRGNALTNVLAAIHRPLWSLAMLGLFLLSVVDRYLGLPDVVLGPAETEIMRTVLIFYFSLRTVDKTVSTIYNGKTATSPPQTSGTLQAAGPRPVARPASKPAQTGPQTERVPLGVDR